MQKKDLIILFDLDGTLIDSTEAIVESFARSFEVLGGEMAPEQEIRCQIGHPLGDMYEALGVPRSMIESYVQTYRENYRQIHRLKTLLLPGAGEAVKYAACRARLGVVTTKTGRYSQELLEHFGLMEYFEVLIGSEDVTRHKPHPEPVLKALKRMGRTEERCWMIGDTCMDMISAAASGIDAVAVECGYGDTDHLARCAPKTAKSVQDALTWIFRE